MAVDLKKTKSINNMKDIAKKGIEEGNNKVIKDIPLNMIDANPDNMKLFSMTDIEGLKNSIIELGFIGAIEVYLMQNGRYQISAGHRRYQAMLELNRQTIPCIVSTLDNDVIVKKKLIESNLHTRTLSPIELAKCISYYEKTLIEDNFNGPIREELARIFAISEGKVGKLKSLLKMVDEIQNLASSVNFPYETFSDAQSFSTEKQKELCNLISEHQRLYPETEITSLVVSQYIDKIKTEINIEETKKQRAKLERIERENDNKKEKESEHVTKKESVELQPLNKLPLDTLNLDIPSIGNEDKNVFMPNDNIIETYDNVSNNNESEIDFDLNLYVDKIERVLKKNNVKIKSAEVRINAISKLQEAIAILKKM